MSENNLSQEKMQALVAGIGSRLRNIFRGLRRRGGWANSGGNSPEARRARVAGQPRDSKGRWIPTGANLRAKISIPIPGGGRRTISMSNLKAIGSTPDGKKIRALIINNDHVKDHPSLAEGNVIEISPENAELLVAKLDREYLKKKGIDPDLKHDLPDSIEDLPDNVEDLNVKEADELDIALALGGLDEDEDKDLRAERDAEPLAKLPPALAKQAAEGKEVSEIVKKAEKGEKEIKPDAPAGAPASPDDLDSLDDEDFEDVEEVAPEPKKPEPKKPEPTKEVSPERQAVQKRIDDLKAKVESDPDKREVLDSIGEARKALNRGKIEDASSWLDEAEALDAEIDTAKANKKRTDDLKANVPEVKEDPDKVDRTIGDEKDGYLAKEMGKPGSKQREYFWQTVDRITSDPKQSLNGFAQGRIADAYASELPEKLNLSDSKLDPLLKSLVDGSKTRAEVVSAIKEKISADSDGLIKAIPRKRLPRDGNRASIKTALDFLAEDKIDERLDDLLPSLDSKLKPAGREYSKEELDAMSKIDRVNAIQGLEPITEETKKTPVSEIAKLNDISDFDGDFGTLPNGENIVPSEEQKNIVSAMLSGAKRIVVNALAGSGKTTTIVGGATAVVKNDPSSRILVWQFSRDNREQAQARFDSNSTMSHTFDSAGYNYGDQNLTKNYDKANKNSSSYNTSPQDVAAELRIEGDMPTKTGENLGLAQQANLVKDIVDRFSYSADTEITDRHIYDPGDSLTPEGKEKLLKYARRYWRTATASTSFPKYSKTREGRRRGGYTGPGSIPPTNNLITKKWALTNPDLGALKHPDGSPITHVFVDEAQDINPVISDILEKQGDNVTIVIVGDANQAIYAFRGAVNGLSRMTKKSEVALQITETRRFGKGLLELPNAALNLLGHDSRIASTKEGGEYTEDIEIDGTKDTTALIVRNNYNGVSAILGMLARDKKVAVPSAFKKDLMDAVLAMEWLDQDPDTRGFRPPGFPADFADISTMRGLAIFARNKDNSKTRAAFWHRILTGDAFDGSVQKLKEFSEKVSVFGEGARGSGFSGEEGATGVLATTAKGDITYTIRDGAIYLDGKGMNAMGKDGRRTFKLAAMGGHTTNDIRDGKNPNWTEYLPGGIRKPDQSPTWRIVAIKDPTAPKGVRFETVFTMPNEADRKTYLENLSTIFSEEVTPDVVITTAHRSKGLEFDNVIIGDDFPGPGTEDKDEKQSESGIPSQDELNLAFVAVSRAKKKLNPGSLAWLSEYKDEDGLNKANSELGRAGTPNPYKDKITEPSAGAAFDFSDITLDGGAQGPRTGEDDEEIEALRRELTRDVSNIFEVSPDSFEGNIGSYFEDPDAEGVYVKLTDFVRTEDEDGEPLFEMYGKYADGSDFEGAYDINRRIKEVNFAEPVAKTPTKKPADKPDPTPTPAATPSTKKTKATDIIEGSSIYDAEGNEMGEVLSKKKQVQKSTGREVVAVTYRDKDGNEQIKRYFADSDVDVDNKGLDEVETPPKPEPKAKPKTVAKTDGDSPEVAQAKADWAELIRLDQEWSKGSPGFAPMDPKKKKERDDKLAELATKYPELAAENKYAQEFLRLQKQLADMPKGLKGSDYDKALRDRLYALRDSGLHHRKKFINDLDKGKVNLKDIAVDESLFGDIPEPQNTPINKLNDTELPTIFGSSWSTNRDGTFSKVVDGVRWNIRENNDGSISVRNRTHGGATQKFESWDEASRAYSGLVEEGKKKNREILKNFIAPYDSDGSIGKMIDDGASAEEIHNALLNNQDFVDALTSREILPISYMAKIGRISGTEVSMPTLNRTSIGTTPLKNPEVPQGYVQTPAGILPQRFANRADDGSEFDAPSIIDMEAISKLTPEGRQAELEQLFESFPNAKFADDGSVVLYRRTKEELGGPLRGQDVTTELRVQSDARANKYNIIVKVTTPDGKSQEFLHYSGQRNSWKALIGTADEAGQGNGVSDLLLKYFNKDKDYFKRKAKRLGWSPKKTEKEIRNSGGTMGALKDLRTANPERELQKILDAKSKGIDLRLRTIEENTAIALNGLGEELSTDLKWWRKRFSGIESFWDAVVKNDTDAAGLLFNNFALSLPNNKDARERALSVVSTGLDSLFPNMNARAKSDLMSRFSDKLAKGVNPEAVDIESRPFVDKNGVTLKVGDHVQWESNVYGKATGKIVKFLPFDGTKDGKFNYTDYVMVKFQNKKKPERLVASNMKKADKDQNPVTEYSHWLRNDDLKIARASQAGYSYDPDRHAIIDSDGDIVELLGQDDTPEDGDSGDDDLFGDDNTGDDGDDNTDDDGDGGDGGDSTPPKPTDTVDKNTTEASADVETLDVSNLTEENITAGAFSNPKKRINSTKAKRTKVGGLLPFGNPQPKNLEEELSAQVFWSYNNFEEKDKAGLVDDPENTIVLKNKKLAEILKLDPSVDVVVVKPTQDSKKAKNILVEKGKTLWENAKASESYKKVIEARKKYEDSITNKSKTLSDMDKRAEFLLREVTKLGISLNDNDNRTPDIDEYSGFKESLPKEISSGVGQFEISEDLAEKLAGYGGDVSLFESESEPSRYFDIHNNQNNAALKMYLENDTKFSKEEVQIIMEAQDDDHLGLYMSVSPTFPQLLHVSSLPEPDRKNLVRIFYAKRANAAKISRKIKEIKEERYDLEAKRLDVVNNKGTVSAYNEWIKGRAAFMRDYLRESGVQMGSRSANDFGDRLVIAEDKKSGWKQDRPELIRAFNEALSFMPDAVVDSLISYLKDTNNVLEFGAIKTKGRKNPRGNFFSWDAKSKTEGGAPKGSIKINVGSAGMDGLRFDLPGTFNAFNSIHTDTSLHELWHFVQHVNPNLGAIESTYMFDKFISENGEPILEFGKVRGYEAKDPPEVGIQGMFQEEYMSKLYPKKAINALLNPEDESSELSTVLMQGLFTNPSFSGRGLGRRIRVKEGGYVREYIDSRDSDKMDGTTEIFGVPTAYYNPADGKYYVDSAFSIPLERGGRSIYAFSGREAGDMSEEDELMSLGLGIMYAFDGAA